MERKNRVVQDMIHGKGLATHFWGEAVNTACYVISRVYLRPGTEKTPYEIWTNKKPTVKHLHVFGSKCYILLDKENLDKFDTKSDEVIFLGYSLSSCASRVYNKRTETMIELVNVFVDDDTTKAHNKMEKIYEEVVEVVEVEYDAKIR
jgi:hypothetical protein